jgi:hypothetical protein
MEPAIKYTKSDLQLSDGALIGAITQIEKELEKMDTPRGRALNKRLLSNFNDYDINQINKMLNNFQRFLVECVKDKENTLDVEYLVKHNLNTLKQIIMF